LTAQRTHFREERIHALRLLQQTLIAENALDAQQAPVHFSHALHGRILLWRRHTRRCQHQQRQRKTVSLQDRMHAKIHR
jgi:hypothetical protein